MGVAFGIWVVLAVLALLMENLQEMGLGGFIRKVAAATGVMAVCTLIGTATSGQVAMPALAGLIVGAVALVFFLFDTEET
jgi:hypothetical protein